MNNLGSLFCLCTNEEKYERNFSNFQTWQADNGAFNNYVDNMRGGGGQKMFLFVHAQGIKTVHAGEGVRK